MKKISYDQRMIHLASQLPEGSALKREILSGLQKSASLSPEEAAKVRDFVLRSVEKLKGRILLNTPDEVVAAFPGNPELKSVTFTDFDKTKGKFFFTNKDGVSGGDGWKDLSYGEFVGPRFGKLTPYLELFNQNILKMPDSSSMAYDLETRIDHVRKIPSIKGLKRLPSEPQSGWNTSANSTDTTYYVVVGENLTPDDDFAVEKFIENKYPNLHPKNKSGNSQYETLSNSIRWNGKSWVVASTSYFRGD